MRRLSAAILILACAFLLLTGTALAGSAPDAMSYFTSSKYNRTYTGSDGLEHAVRVTWVGETWNKVGTVIYSINYEDVYQQDDSTFIDVKSDTEIYENARPAYPNSEQYSVYQVKWYPNGSKEVVSDYRPAEPTATPAASPISEPPREPMAQPTTTPMTTESAASKPVQNVKPSVTPSSEAEAPVSTSNPLPSDSPVPSGTESLEQASTITPSPTPGETHAAELDAEDSASPSASPIQVIATESTGKGAHSGWIWLTISAVGIGALVLLAIRGRKETKDDENNQM